jgi:hypothetical protein
LVSFDLESSSLSLNVVDSMEIGVHYTISPREQFLLAFLGAGQAEESESGLDPIRIMKGMFLLDKNLSEKFLPAEARYKFEPYLYGPFSQGIYSDLDSLQVFRLVEAKSSSSLAWSYYFLTPLGQRQATEFLKSLDTSLSKYISDIHNYVVRHDFATLLKKIYRAYPEYATKSVFRTES